MLKTSNGKEGMLKTSTMDLRMRDLMRSPSIHADRCVVCGRRYPLNEHHIVYRSAGNIFDEDGNPVPKPTITLCGMGNVLRGSDGRYFCHGKAHNGRLHFRMGEWELEYLESEDTISYSDALERDGWIPVSQAHWRRIWIGNR